MDYSADATPETVLGALHTLRTFPATRRITIVGDITDLGAETVVAQKKIGQAAAENVHILIAVGALMILVAGSPGMHLEKVVADLTQKM